jgi:hypothetical protein
MLITEPPPALISSGMPNRHPDKCAVKVELDRPPEFVERRVDRGVVLLGRAAGIVVEHVEAAELVDGGADRRLQAVGVGHIGTDRDGFVPGEVSSFLARPDVDLSDGDFRAFAGEQDSGGAADPGTGAGD